MNHCDRTLAALLSRSVSRFAPFAAQLFLVLQVGGLAITWGGPDADRRIGWAEPPPELFRFSSERNVIHIVLDEFQTDVFVAMLEEDGGSLGRTFTGFTFFADHLGAFPSTSLSMPAMLTGKEFRNEQPVPEFVRQAFSEGSIFASLNRAGYAIDATSIIPTPWFEAWFGPSGSPVDVSGVRFPIRKPFVSRNDYREWLCCNFRAATSGWTTFGKHRTGSPIMPSDNPFKWRQFEPALILQCVRWYLRYALSYRDLEDMMRERGLCVDHTTIYRWVQRYAPEIDKRCRPFLRRTNDSYRIDETYVRVAGAWTYLYRGVDSNGDTLDFLLRATRDRKAAIAFFRKTLGAAHTTPPRVVTVDKNPAYPVAFEAVRHEGLVRPRSNLRQCKYLNNIIEQDHRFIKRRTRPMLGFKRFTTAWRTLRGIEIMHALRKGQARWMAKGDVVGQTQLIHKVFGLAA